MRFGTHIAQAPSTRSCISSASMAARRTGTQLKRMSDWLGSENLYGSDSTSSSRNSFGSVFSPDGNYLASAHDGSVQLRETATGRVVTGVNQPSNA
jgi:hypothetical protein